MHFKIFNENADLVDALHCPVLRHKIGHFLKHLRELHHLGYHIVDPQGNVLSHVDLHELLHHHMEEEENDYDRGWGWGRGGGRGHGWGYGRDWDRGWGHGGGHGFGYRHW